MTCQRAMRGERSAWPVRPDAEGLFVRSDGLAAVRRVPSAAGAPHMFRALRAAAHKSHDSHESHGTNATNGTNEPAAWEEIFPWCHQSLAIAQRDCDRAVPVEEKKEVRS